MANKSGIVFNLESRNIVSEVFSLKQNYDKQIAILKEMRVHSLGDNPSNLLITRHTNEDAITLKWRQDNYTPITRPIYQRAINAICRVFNEANYYFQLSEDLSNYIDSNRFSGMSFVSYLQNHVLKYMIEDPNAYLVVLPIPNEDLSVTDKIDTEIEIVPSDRLFFAYSDAICWLSCEKSMINGREKQGDVYYLLTDTFFARIVQTKSFKDANSYVFELIYVHNLGTLSAQVLGGYWNPNGYYESYFNSFKDYANEAIRQFSDWQAIMALCAYPTKEIRADQCDFEGCEGGHLYSTGDDGTKNNLGICRSCEGYGYKMKTGPFGAFVRPHVSGINPSEDTPMMRYITPDISVIQYSENAWKTLIEKAEQSLNINFILDAQSGIAKQVDREELYSFLTAISNNIYRSIAYNALLYMEYYRNFNNPIVPQITPPTSFNTKTETQLQEEFNAYSTSQVAKSVVIESHKQLIDKKFGGDPYQLRITDILSIWDVLFLEQEEVKMMKFQAGILTKEMYLKSFFAYYIIEQLVNKNGKQWFITEEIDTIIQRMDEIFYEMYQATIEIKTVENIEAQAPTISFS